MALQQVASGSDWAQYEWVPNTPRGWSGRSVGASRPAPGSREWWASRPTFTSDRDVVERAMALRERMVANQAR